ncbi:MAG: hypothetical protein VX265_19155 [Myxococcota bacterium]|nr:hypothetical protein [Myxococcota bacterium]
MAADRITLRVDARLRQRIVEVQARLSASALSGRRAVTLSDAARHCLELGLSELERTGSGGQGMARDAPVAGRDDRVATHGVAPPPPSESRRTWAELLDEDDEDDV